jgi:hypothetical protein
MGQRGLAIFGQKNTQSWVLVVRFMLPLPGSELSQRTTSLMFGGPIHAAVGNRQQRPDH